MTHTKSWLACQCRRHYSFGSKSKLRFVAIGVSDTWIRTTIWPEDFPNIDLLRFCLGTVYIILHGAAFPFQFHLVRVIKKETPGRHWVTPLAFFTVFAAVGIVQRLLLHDLVCKVWRKYDELCKTARRHSRRWDIWGEHMHELGSAFMAKGVKHDRVLLSFKGTFCFWTCKLHKKLLRSSGRIVWVARVKVTINHLDRYLQNLILYKCQSENLSIESFGIFFLREVASEQSLSWYVMLRPPGDPLVSKLK